MTGQVVALVGAQYGSEGKGLVASHLANHFNIHIRTGAPNAGHTFYHTDAERYTDDEGEKVRTFRRKFVARSLPCGWTNLNADIVIGPGALVDRKLLIDEFFSVEAAGFSLKGRTFLDEKAMIISPVHQELEGHTYGEAHRLIGSTGEGVGAARMAKINRRSVLGHGGIVPSWSVIQPVTAHREEFETAGFELCDTSKMVTERLDKGAWVMLEGTQGCGLSLTHGEWPYVTSTDTNAASLLADAGISPRRLTQVVLVARTFPIRVAGTSGPLRDEISFEDLGVSPEFTTVTKKKRRIGRWDDVLFEKAVRLNGPCDVVITFADYLWPGMAGVTDYADVPTHVRMWTHALVQWFPDIRVAGFGTGPDSMVIHPGSWLS